MNNRNLTLTTAIFTIFLTACAGPAPIPEPGMKILQHSRNEEMQVVPDVDWSKYNKIILHSAPVEFRENWQRDQERRYGSSFREADIERFKTTVSDQLAKVMQKRISEQGDYELTHESGPGVMHFMPNIVDLDIDGPGWVQSSIVEKMTNTRGSMTIEVVIRDSETDQLLAVAWQEQADPQEGYLEMTNTINNTVAFRLMMQRWNDWLFAQLDKAKDQ